MFDFLTTYKIKAKYIAQKKNTMQNLSKSKDLEMQTDYVKKTTTTTLMTQHTRIQICFQFYSVQLW